MAIELADKLYTSTQVADILGVSLRTLYRYMEDNKIKSMRTASGRHRFTKDHIIEFLNAGRGSMMEEVSAPSPYGSPRNSGYPNMPQNQAPMQNAQRNNYFDNMQAAPTNMPNPYSSGSNFSGMNQPSQSGNSMYGRDDNMSMQNSRSAQPQRPYAEPVVEQEDDFEFDVTSYDYDSNDSDTNNRDQDTNKSANFNDDFEDEDFGNSRSNYTPVQESRVQQSPVQPQQQAPRSSYAQSTYAPPASTSAREESRPEPMAADNEANLNVRYYRSDYTDLIELAKKIKDTSNAKDLEYAFTLYAGLSLHFLIRPFTVLNFYANPEDMQLWKDELRLVPAQKKEDANVGIIINTDIVFVPVKEIGGFKVVDDKILLRDLSSVKEEELVKQFRQHLTAI